MTRQIIEAIARRASQHRKSLLLEHDVTAVLHAANTLGYELVPQKATTVMTMAGNTAIEDEDGYSISDQIYEVMVAAGRISPE